MSGNIKLKKSNILKRLSIPSISEIKFKEALLKSLKEKEPDLTLKKKDTLNLILNSQKSFDVIEVNKKEKKIQNDIHSLELKIEELENSNKLKDEELININKQLNEEKNKVQNLLDIIAKKEIKIDSLKKNLDKSGDKNNNNESKQNNLIKIDIINKSVEYNLNMENIHLKEEMKLINEENIKLKSEIEKNKEIIINLQKDIEKIKTENEKILNENSKNIQNNLDENNNIKGKKLIINDEIVKFKTEIQTLKEKNEKYKKDIKLKEDIINKLKEENNYYIKVKNEAERKIYEINSIHQILQNELEEIKQSVNEKEKSNNDIINNLKDEAIEAKIKYADLNYQNDVKYMKLKKQFDKLLSTLDSYGIKVKEIK